MSSANSPAASAQPVPIRAPRQAPLPDYSAFAPESDDDVDMDIVTSAPLASSVAAPACANLASSLTSSSASSSSDDEDGDVVDKRAAAAAAPQQTPAAAGVGCAEGAKTPASPVSRSYLVSPSDPVEVAADLGTSTAKLIG